MPEAARTIVKSPPELWAEVSDPDALARHLGAFGEIRITRLEPEATVAWEGSRIRGTVDLAPAGWGTKVTVTAEQVAAVEESALEPPAEVEPQAAAKPAAEPQRRRGRFARWFARPARPGPEPAPEAVEPTPEPEPAQQRPDPSAVLDGMLGSLGSAHHRPFSR
jgi:hypothetical protein